MIKKHIASNSIQILLALVFIGMVTLIVISAVIITKIDKQQQAYHDTTTQSLNTINDNIKCLINITPPGTQAEADACFNTVPELNH